MNTAAAATFRVSDVTPTATPLPEVPYKEAVEAQLPSGQIEACSRYHGRLLAQVAYHPVIASIHRAFMNHRPLCLSPDMIWLMICQGVANHINANEEELRPSFVSHKGKLTIEVRRDDFVKGSPENPWAEVFHEFSEQIGTHVGDRIRLFIPHFSTTGKVERAAAEVVLLDAMQSFFEYRVYTLCGIPTITLEGTNEDWKALAERAQSFRQFGLDPWFDVLTPILRQFVGASQGDVDTEFWQSLYKFNSVSGGAVINGWVTGFFPYRKDLSTGRASQPSPVMRGDDEEVEQMLYPGERRCWHPVGFSVGSFPSGLSKAPFRWWYLDQTIEMEFLGGFVGVAQDQDTLTLRPEIGWAVREAPAAI
jgi:hypothetical protein